jgi:hypothetical protein
MKRLSLYVVCVLFAALVVSCMTPQQQSAALDAVDQMMRSGAITRAQWEAMREAILSASSASVWGQIGTAVAGAGLGWLGVRLQRGPPATPEERVKRCAPKG